VADFDPQSPEWQAFRMSVRLHHGHVLEEAPGPFYGRCLRCRLAFTPERRLRYGWMSNGSGGTAWTVGGMEPVARDCPGRDING
jgi:hypothetical protein